MEKVKSFKTVFDRSTRQGPSIRNKDYILCLGVLFESHFSIYQMTTCVHFSSVTHGHAALSQCEQSVPTQIFGLQAAIRKEFAGTLADLGRWQNLHYTDPHGQKKYEVALS